MFSGIIETTSEVLEVRQRQNILELTMARPSFFDDIKLGDSICVNGICLTVEFFDEKKMRFALGPETLKITGWDHASLQNKKLNLERSMRLGDRIHGHLVSGHVDSMGKVVLVKSEPESLNLSLVLSLVLQVELQDSLLPFVFKKGSITLNGVSLTINQVINEVMSHRVEVCLIPETLKRTNLSLLKVGDFVNVEPDFMTKAAVQAAMHTVGLGAKKNDE